MNEHESEPVRGLPEPLPEGEAMLWQGAPDWKALAVRAFHVRKVSIYFALLLAWLVGSKLSDGVPLADAAWYALPLVVLAVAAVGLLTLLAWLIGLTTVYTITSRRTVVRFGVALQMIVNLPFRAIVSAALRDHGDGTGDIVLSLSPSDHVAYVTMWPHVRPWHFSNPEPMFRCIPNAADVADILGPALAASLTAAASAQRAVDLQQNDALQPRAAAAA